jgi:hypothetical protein
MQIIKHTILIVLISIITYTLFNVASQWIFNFFFEVTSDNLSLVVAIVIMLIPTLLVFIFDLIEKKISMKITYSVPVGFLITAVVLYLQAYSKTSFDLFELPSLRYIGAAIALMSFLFALVYFLATRTKFMFIANISAISINIIAIIYALSIKFFR